MLTLRNDETTETITPVSDAEQIRELLESFLSGKSKQTIRAYRADLEAFAGWMDTEPTQAVHRLLANGPGPANHTTLKYKAHLQEQGRTPATVNRRLSSVRSLVALAQTIGLISWQLKVKNAKAEKFRDCTGPGTGNVKRMLHQLQTRNDPKGCRDTALVRMAYDLALRRNELVTLDLSDLDLQNRIVDVLSKGQTQKTKMTLPERTIEALQEWLNIRGDEPGPLFTSMDRAKKGDGRLSGVKARPHGLRHSSISRAVQVAQANGYGLEQVMDYSRHANVQTVLVYRDKEEDAGGEIAKLVSESL